MVYNEKYKAKQAAYEARPEQKKRRAARNRARNEAIKAGKVHKGDGKELDHTGYHPYGSLDNVPTKVVSRHANRTRQPPGRLKRDYGKRK